MYGTSILEKNVGMGLIAVSKQVIPQVNLAVAVIALCQVTFQFPSTEHRHSLASSKLYCLLTDAYVCEQLVRDRQ